MFARAVLAYVIVLPFLIMAAVDTQYNIAVSLSSNVPGRLQIYYFKPDGTSGGIQTALRPGPATRVYRLQVPAGEYQHLRIDPGTAPGTYSIDRIALLTGGEATPTAIPLTHFAPNGEVAVREITRRRLTLDARGDDPQLLYSPSARLSFPATAPMPRSLVARLALWWTGIFLGIWGLEHVSRWSRLPTPTVTSVVASSVRAAPRAALAAVACLSTALSTYPVLLFDRSFVAPNNGGSPQLYDGPPFVPGSTDNDIEDVRGSDTAATTYEFVPYSFIQREALEEGELPLWNRYNAAGRPLWGQGMSFLLDPLHLLTLFTPNPYWGWDLKFIAHRFVFALGIGLAALAATGAWGPAALAAAAAPFIGFFAYRLSHPAVFSISYVPWVLLSVFLMAESVDARGRRRAGLLLAASTALVIVASIPKETAVILIGLALAAAPIVLTSPGTMADRGRRLGAAMVAGLAAVMLTAPQWLVFLDTLRQSIVPPYDKPEVLFAGTRDAIALVLSPLMPGDVLPGLHPLFVTLVFAAVCAPQRVRRQPGLLACGLSAAFLLAIAFGVLPANWIARIPFIANIGHIHDVFVTAAVVPLIIIAAFGAHVLLNAGHRRRTAVVILTGCVAWWITRNVAATAPPQAIEIWIAALLLGLAAALPLCFFRSDKGNHNTVSFVASVGAAAALVVPGGLHLLTQAPSIDRLLVQPRMRLETSATAPSLEAVRHLSEPPARTAGMNWTLVPGIQAVYGLEAIGGADALQIPVYEELVNAGGIQRLGSWFTTVEPASLGRVSPLLDLLNVRSLVGRPDVLTGGIASAPEVSLDQPDRLRVLRRDSSWPRAFFVDGVVEYLTASDLLSMVATQRAPFAGIQAGDQRALDCVRTIKRAGGAALPASNYSLTANTTTFVVHATSAGVAVLSESFLAADFRATLNGTPVPYFRVNHAFKAVVIPSAGTWTVSFRYVPARWTLAWTLTGLGLVVVAGIAIAPALLRARTRTA